MLDASMQLSDNFHLGMDPKLLDKSCDLNLHEPSKGTKKKKRKEKERLFY